MATPKKAPAAQALKTNAPAPAKAAPVAKKAIARKAVAKGVAVNAAPAAAKPAAVAKATPVAAAKKAVAKKAPAAKVAKLTKVTKIEGPAIDPSQRANYIEVAAYYIAQRRGFTPGDPQQDYLDAAAEVDQLIAAGHFGK